MELDGHLFGEGQPCFGCAPDHPVGFRLRFSVEDDAVITRFTAGNRYQGPPGIMHGGLVMTLGDELAAWTLVGLKQRFGFTTHAEVKLKKAIRIGTEVTGRGTIAEDKQRLVDLAVTLFQEDEVCFEGRFRFALLDQSAAERLLGGTIPEAWKKLARH